MPCSFRFTFDHRLWPRPKVVGVTFVAPERDYRVVGTVLAIPSGLVLVLAWRRPRSHGGWADACAVRHLPGGPPRPTRPSVAESNKGASPSEPTRATTNAGTRPTSIFATATAAVT